MSKSQQKSKTSPSSSQSSYLARRKNKRRGERSLIRNSLIAIGCVLALAVVLSIYVSQEEEMHRLAAEQLVLQAAQRKEMQEAEAINELRSMAGSKEFIERIARDELGLVRPEEIIFTD